MSARIPHKSIQSSIQTTGTAQGDTSSPNSQTLPIVDKVVVDRVPSRPLTRRLSTLDALGGDNNVTPVPTVPGKPHAATVLIFSENLGTLDGAAYTVNKNKAFAVALHADQASGYNWQAIPTPTTAAPTVNFEDGDATSSYGVGKVEVFTWDTTDAKFIVGQTYQLTFNYTRAGDATPQRIVKMSVTIV